MSWEKSWPLFRPFCQVGPDKLRWLDTIIWNLFVPDYSSRFLEITAAFFSSFPIFPPIFSASSVNCIRVNFHCTRFTLDLNKTVFFTPVRVGGKENTRSLRPNKFRSSYTCFSPSSCFPSLPLLSYIRLSGLFLLFLSSSLPTPKLSSVTETLDNFFVSHVMRARWF